MFGCQFVLHIFCWAFWLLRIFCFSWTNPLKQTSTQQKMLRHDFDLSKTFDLFKHDWNIPNISRFLGPWWLRVPGIHRRKGPPIWTWEKWRSTEKGWPRIEERSMDPIENGDIPASYVRKYQIFTICLGFEIMCVFCFQKWVVKSA